ncbi:PQQ-binding-like beta-propeller repeat protein [Halorubrum distributum]|uniref:PQQ-binding-like beta-propeller repeat protein n=1 Tax=Halorubrum distributum TaxID=29283 RepID=A0A6B1IJ33_9EURY|nr:PQQ-binding-like beta-propeller repeat protein [Halorubrum terrestre]MYL66377.1 PQQ-binding-like beta-propeller repeat protein [Halorubrum terrestre]
MPSRRAFLSGLGAAGLTATAGCLAGFDADPGSDETYGWPSGGGNDWNSRAVPNGTAPRDDPTVDRTHEFDGIPAGDPVVTAGTVLLNTGVDVIAFDREDLSRRWSVAPDDNGAFSYTGAPAVADGVAYVPERDTLVARDLDTGERLWSRGFEYVFRETTPLVIDRGDDHRVVIGAGEYLRAFDGATGELRWERRLDGIVRGPAARALASVYGTVYAATTGGELYAVDHDGRVRWNRTVNAGIRTAPTVVGSRGPNGNSIRGSGDVVVGDGDGSVRCFDPTGGYRWRTGLRGFVEGGIAAGHGGVFAVSGGRLYALNAESGNHAWRTGIGNATRPTPPALVGDTIYVGGERLHGVDVGGGVGVRSVRVGETRFEHGVDGGASYVTAADGTLFATVAGESGSGRLVVLS